MLAFRNEPEVPSTQSYQLLGYVLGSKRYPGTMYTGSVAADRPEVLQYTAHSATRQQVAASVGNNPHRSYVGSSIGVTVPVCSIVTVTDSS